MQDWVDHHCHLSNRSLFSESLYAKKVFSLSLDEYICIQKNPLYHEQLFSLGIHPWYIPKDWHEVLKTIEQYTLSDRRIVAIGECGVDIKRKTAPSLILQKKVFEKQWFLAHSLQLPLIIHNVGGSSLLASQSRTLPPLKNAMIHGFRGKKEEAEMLLSNGFTLSMGVLGNEESAQKAYEKHRLRLETDDSRTPILNVYKKWANTLGVSLEDLKRETELSILGF